MKERKAGHQSCRINSHLLRAHGCLLPMYPLRFSSLHIDKLFFFLGQTLILFKFSFELFVCICMITYVYVHGCMYVYVHVYIYVCVHTHVHVYVSVNAGICGDQKRAAHLKDLEL